MINLIIEGQLISIPLDIANMSKTIKDSLEIFDGSDEPLPLPNTTLSTFMIAVKFYQENSFINVNYEEWKNNLKKNGLSDEQLTFFNVIKYKTDIGTIKWDFSKVDFTLLKELIMTVNFLDMNYLFDVCSKVIADFIYHSTPQQIMETFGRKEPPTEEEMQRIIAEHPYLEGAEPPIDFDKIEIEQN
jgi:hypothetical protein